VFKILNFGAPIISLEQLKLDISNLVYKLIVMSTTIYMFKFRNRLMGCIQGQVSF